MSRAAKGPAPPPDGRWQRVYLGLGSNLGDRAAQLAAALAALEQAGVAVRRRSPLYETRPVGVVDQPPFLNAVAEADTSLAPLVLLAEVKAIERALGRVPGPRWGPRAIDIDILLYGDAHVACREPWLEIPHPGLWDRQFVLVPLADLRPDLRDPSGTPIAERIARLRAAEGEAVWPYDAEGALWRRMRN
jgi:2-amino-4-hydroxy-6-hydroxymethyldihydropteridine diphosphokinase